MIYIKIHNWPAQQSRVFSVLFQIKKISQGHIFSPIPRSGKTLHFNRHLYDIFILTVIYTANQNKR